MARNFLRDKGHLQGIIALKILVEVRDSSNGEQDN